MKHQTPSCCHRGTVFPSPSFGHEWREDTHLTEDPRPQHAIYRLSENLYNHRVFCIKRASDLTMRLQILPKEQRTNYEEEKFHLEPHPRELYFLNCEAMLLGCI
uniref:Cytochrome b-c1 complex subunit 7 n=1 Tax=Sus scrofa TaxID=9823 RepID=A0A4X1SV89_PIG